jgi:uncharacterized caspase-like protein
MNRLLSWVVGVAAAAIVVIAGSNAAWAERRVALVVGNSNYKAANISLSNPRNDAQDISAVLTNLGFEVVTTIDATKRDMDFALQRFARLATDADSALFFYAGHAMQFQGRNFLMPTDAELEDEISVRYQTVALEEVRAALDRANGVKIMILDACRNNPLADRLQKTIVGASRSVSMSRGLARIDKTQGMVVAYATAADEVAQDGQGRNSPFTTALLKRLQEPGLEIEMMFRRVAYDVNAQTGGRQRPETYISLLSEYYLNQSDRVVWDRIKDQDDIAALRDFANKYPSSPLAVIARNRVEASERYAKQREEDDRRAREAEQRERLRAEQLAAQKQIEEEKKRQEALRQQTAEQKRQEALRLQQEEQKRQEALRLQQEEQKRQEALRLQGEEQKRQEALRLQGEEQKRQEALRLQQEEQKRVAALLQKQEEQKRQEALRQQQEEQKRIAALQQKQEEQKRQEALQPQQEEQKRIAALQQKQEEQKRQDALRQQQEEQKRVAALQVQEEQKRQEASRQQQVDLDRKRIEDNCRREEAKLAELQTAGAAAREQLVKFEIEAGCKALHPMITAAIAALPLDAPVPHVPPPVATPPAYPQVEKANLPEQIRQAQIELRRLGCFEGKLDSKMNGATEKAVKAFWKHTHKSIVEINITDDFIANLQRLPNEICPPPSKPAPPPMASQPPSRSKNATAAAPPPPRQAPPAPPQDRARATAGSSGPTIGTGF